MGILELFENKKLKEDFEDLKQKYDILKVDFNNKNQELHEVKIEKIKLFNDIRDMLAKVNILDNKVFQKENEIMDLKKEIDNYKVQLESKKSEAEELKKNKEILEKKFLDSKIYTTKLEQKNQDLAERESTLYKAYCDLKDKEFKLKTYEKSKKIAQIITELKKLIILREQKTKTLLLEQEFLKYSSTTDEQKNQLKDQLLRKDRINERLKEELNRALEAQEYLNKENLNIKKEIADKKIIYGDLEKEISAKNRTIQDLNIKIENLTWQNKENKNYKNIYEKQIEDLKEELTLSKKMYKELESNSKALELEWVGEKKKNNKILEELEEYKDKLTKLEEKLKIQEDKQKLEIKEEIISIEIKSVEEKKAQENLKVEVKPIDPVEKIIKRENISILKWNNHEEFIKNKDNLIEYLKSFSSEDFQKIYFQVKERGIIKKAQEKYFSNILIRIKWNLPLTTMDIEKIEPLYKELMNRLLRENRKTSIILEFKDKEKNSKDEKIDKEIMNILF